MGGHLTEADFLNAKDERFFRESTNVESTNDNDLSIFEGDIILEDDNY